MKERFKSWQDLRSEIYTPEEIAASDLRVALMGEIVEARKQKRITQKQLEEMCGVRQPVIARMETGTSSPNLDTVLKILGALGKTLYVGNIEKHYPTKDIRNYVVAEPAN